MYKVYKNELNREDLKDHVKHVVKWRYVDGKISATCKWSAKAYHIYPKEIESKILFSPGFSAGDQEELKWEIQLDRKENTFIDVRLNFFNLRGTKYDYVISVLNKNLDLETWKHFSQAPMSLSHTSSTELSFRYESFLRHGKTTLILIVGIIAEPFRNCLPYLPQNLTFSPNLFGNKEQQKEDLKPVSKIKQDFENLLDDKVFSDLTLIVDGEKLTAHKVILAARSPIFFGMLSSENKKHSKLEYEIKDSDYNTIKELLHFLYTGHLHELNEESAKKLILTSHKYAVKDLHAKCQKLLCKFLNIDNAVEMLKLADLCDAKDLKDSSMSLLVNNIKNIEECKLMPLSSDLLIKILVGVTKKT